MKRSKHSLSHYRLTTLNQGALVPVACEEVLPGDSFRHGVSCLIRVSPLVAPVMHPVTVSIHSWFVPNRIIWDNWENFITGKDTSLTVPVMSITAGSQCQKLAQAFGIGSDTMSVSVNALPFRAYNLIWNEFYRDQDILQKLTENKGDTGDLPSQYIHRSVMWEKDYFTTSRAFPQQGTNTEVVNLALSGEVPVKGLGMEPSAVWAGTNKSVKETGGATRTYTTAIHSAGTQPSGMWAEQSSTAGVPNIRADLSGMAAGSVTMDINEWRKSMALQRMREHRNRYGSRYRDMLAFLGVHSSDARLQRPEYLGGGKQTISFSEVLSTAETTDAVVGDMAGHGIAALRTRPYKRFFEEHGYMITLLSVRPRTVYQQRIPRHFLRRDYEQYWQKELEMMGEQQVTNAEIYADSASPSGVFGYIPRYDEYRHAESSVAGEFRDLLDYWHMARKFVSQPALNATFVTCDATDRIYASTTNHQLYAMIAHRISARRLVSKKARN